LPVIAVLTLLLANTFNLESISTSGSAGFLLIFGLVNFVNYKLAKQIKSSKIIALTGFILCIMALTALLIQQFETNPQGAWIGISIIILSFIFEWIYKTLIK